MPLALAVVRACGQQLMSITPRSTHPPHKTHNKKGLACVKGRWKGPVDKAQSCRVGGEVAVWVEVISEPPPGGVRGVWVGSNECI